jgi:DNA replication protein DnaC
MGIKACETGKKVYFCDMGNLIKILKEANPKREAFLNKVSLLIIDEEDIFQLRDMKVIYFSS